MTNHEKEQIQALRLQGYGYLKIGQLLGLSNNAVRSFCRRNGASVLIGLFKKRCHTNGFSDFRATNFPLFTSQYHSE